jgi:hypothetical protein
MALAPEQILAGQNPDAVPTDAVNPAASPLANVPAAALPMTSPAASPLAGYLPPPVAMSTGVSLSPQDQFRQQSMQNADRLIADASGPGAWAKALIGGVQSALSGAGAVGKVPEGGGWLYGAGKALGARQEQQRQAQQDKQKQQQQQFENTEKQKNDAIMNAHTQALTIAVQRQAARLDEEDMDKHVAAGKVAAAPYDAHHTKIADGITEDEFKANFGVGKKYDPDKMHGFQTGTTEVEKNGKLVTEPTYTLYENTAQKVKVDKDQSALLEKYGETVPPDSMMDGDVYDHAITKALAAQTTTNAINAAAREGKIKEMEENGKIQTMQDRTTVAPFLGSHPDDPITALGEAAQQKDDKGQPTDTAQAAQRLLSGWDPKELETYRHNVEAETTARIAANVKAAKEKPLEIEGDPKLSGPAYIASLPSGRQNFVRTFGNGQMGPVAMARMASGKDGQLFLAEVAQAYPNINMDKIDEYPALVKEYNPNGKTGKSIMALNTALPHFDKLYSAVTENPLAAFPVVGTAEAMFGSKTASAVATAKTQASQELASLYASGAVTDQEHAEFKKELDAATPANLKNNIENIIDMVQSKINAAKYSWDQGAPSPDFHPPINIVSPEGQGAMDHITALQEGIKNPPPARAFAQVSEGKTTTFPNGQKWTRIDGVPKLVGGPGAQ